MLRKVMKDFTFSNGTTVPAGATVVIAGYPTHHDEVSPLSGLRLLVLMDSAHKKNYPNPGTFDGLRFANLRKGEGESLRHQMVSLSSEYVIFGNGRHAWFVLPSILKGFALLILPTPHHSPGRFFAVNEVKALLVHVVLNYDVKLETEGVRPPNRWFGLTALPHPTAVIMFRKRSGFF
jgi:cytochrome P450